MTSADYKALLERYSSFAECLLLDYWSEDLCRTFTVLISNIWNPDGTLRQDLDNHAPVYLRFEQCQRILIENHFPQSMLDHHEKINFSISEFSMVRASEIENGMIRFQFSWEDERKIEIDFYSLQVDEEPSTPEFQAKYAFPYLRPAQ